jgi:hypothetical protein
LNILATRIRTRVVELLTELTAQLLDVASAGSLLADPVINAEARRANTREVLTTGSRGIQVPDVRPPGSILVN